MSARRTQLDEKEYVQLANINDVTITNAQWGYIGSADQDLSTTATPTFAQVLLTNVPTNASHASTKSYVDALVAAGVLWKEAVTVATTGNITLSGEQTLDGTLTSNSRVLVWQQTSTPENGIYISAAGAWSRATDFDGSPITEVALGAAVSVLTGTQYGNASFVVSTSPATIDVNDLSFAQLTFGNAGLALTSVGSTLALDPTASFGATALAWTGTGTGSLSYDTGLTLTTAGDLALESTQVTSNALINVEVDSEQLRLAYTGTKFTSFEVDSGGSLDITPGGGIVGVTGGITATRTTTQLVLNYDGANNTSFEVGSDGRLTITPSDTEGRVIIAGAIPQVTLTETDDPGNDWTFAVTGGDFVLTEQVSQTSFQALAGGAIEINSSLDTIASVTLPIGATNASRIELSRSGIPTEVKGTFLTERTIDTPGITQLDLGTVNANQVNLGRNGGTTNVLSAMFVEGRIDTTTPAVLLLGNSAATKVEIADAAIETEVQGTLHVIQPTSLFITGSNYTTISDASSGIEWLVPLTEALDIPSHLAVNVDSTNGRWSITHGDASSRYYKFEIDLSLKTSSGGASTFTLEFQEDQGTGTWATGAILGNSGDRYLSGVTDTGRFCLSAVMLVPSGRKFRLLLTSSNASARYTFSGVNLTCHPFF